MLHHPTSDGDAIDDEIDRLVAENETPPFPLRCHTVKSFEWRSAKLVPHVAAVLKGPKDPSVRALMGNIEWINYTNRSAGNIYTFDTSGLRQSTISPVVGGPSAYSQYSAMIIVEVLQSLTPDHPLAKEFKITDKTPDEDRFVYGRLDLYWRDFHTDGDHPGSVYLEDLGLFVSTDPNTRYLLTGDNHSAVLRSWLQNGQYRLNCDYDRKLCAFVNDAAPFDTIYQTSDGKLIEEVKVIRTPVVPAGQIYYRLTTIRTNGSRHTTAHTADLRDIDMQGGMIVHHSLAIGLNIKSFRQWCIKHPLRNMRFAYEDTDAFTADMSPEKTINELQRQIKDLKAEVKRKEEIIGIYRNKAQDIVTKTKKGGQPPMSDVDDLLRTITQGLAAPSIPLTFTEKSKAFSDIVGSLWKSIDSVYKTGAAIVASVSLIAGLFYKFWPKPRPIS